MADFEADRGSNIVAVAHKVASQSRIGAHTHLTGTLQFTEILTVYGRFNGRISGGAMLVIESGGRVEGEIEVDTLIVRGHVSGNVLARSATIIEESGVVHADIKTKDIHIATRAQYQGHCTTSLAE